MSDSNGDASAFRSDINGLRGIAVFIVVAFHCGLTGFSGGFIGVDIFFVLSGYLISALLQREIERESRLNLVGFYGRRVRRLLPASAFVLLVTLLASAFLLGPDELVVTAKAAFAIALNASNIYFGRVTADYFALDSSTNPLLHTWSLSVEEQFYLVWPLLMMAGLQYARSKRVVYGLLAFVTAASFFVCVWSTPRDHVFAFYQLPARAWEFGIGGLSAIAIRSPARRVAIPLAWLGLAGLVLSTTWIDGGDHFPGWIALLPCLSASAVLVSGTGLEWLLDSKPLQFLGTLSYSWYLWHWPLLVLAEAMLPDISVPVKVAVAAAALGVAFVGHRLIENPIRFHPALTASSLRSLAVGGSLAALSLVAAMATYAFALRLQADPKMLRVAAVVNAQSESPFRSCMVAPKVIEVETCEFGVAVSNVSLVLFGDSHAYQWLATLSELAMARGWRLTTVLKSGCPAADIRPPLHGEEFQDACDQWRDRALRTVVALHPSAVVIGNSAGHLWYDRAKLTSHVVGERLSAWTQGNQRTLSALAAAGLPVAQIRDNPRMRFDVPRCVARTLRHSWYPLDTCSMSREAALDESIHSAEMAAARGLSGVAFIDLSSQYCDDSRCRSVRSDEIMYSDAAHLSLAFSRGLRAPFEEALRRGLGEALVSRN